MPVRPHPPQVPDDVLFGMCEQFFDGKGASKIAQWLESEHDIKLTREQVYPLITLARRRGQLLLCPPQERLLQELVAARYKRAKDQVLVVNVPRNGAREHVVAAAADLTLTLIKKLGAERKTVHVGLGPGTTGLDLSRRLGFRLRSEPKVPELVIHALTAGFAQLEPLAAPVAFFSFFHGAIGKVGHVGLFAPGIMQARDYDAKVKEVIGLKEAFAAAADIDIVVSSLGPANDPHTRFNRLMEEYASAKDRLRLAKAGYLGDLQYRPFNAEGPIVIDTGIRPVTLFELDGIKRLAETPGKYVVIVAGPCGECGRSKADVLRSMLESAELRTMWTHLVTDVATARELLQ